jgi:RecB family exonuclease
MWQVATPHLGPAERASATSLEALIGCPLRWVLDYRANVRDGSLVSLPAEHILYGKLGHRLIELLHKGGAFELNGAGLRKRAHATLDELVRREAATLLLPGKAGELAQVRHQLAKAAVHLADVLKRSKLEIVEVERKEEVSWGSRTLAGRLDLLLVDRDQRDVVLDLKWGRTSYVEKLRSGTALQLAVYAYLRKTAGGGGAFPAVAYFSLSSGTPLATDDATFDGAQVTGGDDIETTWARTETAAQLVERTLTSGRIPVAGVSRALAVVEACGAPDGGGALSLASDAACTYCVHDPVCGRRWEQLS